MLICDAHADTLAEWAKGRQDTHIKIEDITWPHLQVFAAFSGHGKDPWGYVNRLIDTFDALGGYEKIKSKAGLSLARFAPAALLSVEDGICLQGDMERVYRLKERGVSMLGLTWNYQNEIASGCLSENDTGLTDFGRELIKVLEKLGITVDLAHIGERGFFEAMALVTKPPVVSHGNYKNLTEHKRNITKEQFLALAQKGGVIGVSLYPEFLTGTQKATLSDVIRHIDALLALGGEDHVGIGTDFDGISCLPENVTGSDALFRLSEELCRLYGESVAEKVMGGNFLRVFNLNLM